LEFRQIRYALSVAKERSFTKAATRLNISQSAVCEQVKLLEDEVGFALFRRTPRRHRGDRARPDIEALSIAPARSVALSLFRRRQPLSRRKEGYLAALRDALKD
jgi:DNA-binding transcriptional LysR family regulator